MISQYMNTKKEKMRNFLQNFGRLVVPTALLLVMTVFQSQAQCTITCPADVNRTVAFGTCDVAVSYATPTLSGVCTEFITGFTGELANSNWAFNTSGDGTITSASTTGITLTGNNNGVAGSSQYCITLDFHDHLGSNGEELSTSTGNLTFDWNYVSSNANAGNDPFFVSVNGTDFQVTTGAPGSGLGATTQNGIVPPLSVNDGDVLCFDQRSYSGSTGSATTTITDLNLVFFYTPTLISGPASGSDFGIGTTTVTYQTYNPNSLSNSTCTLDVIVTESGTPTGTLSCNDLVQVSLDGACEFTVTPDQILEGSSYGCLDKYSVSIYNETTGAQYGDTVSSANIGETLTVEITAPNNNKCWGSIVVEDKNPTPLTCNDAWTRCDQEITPGATTPTSYTISNAPALTVNEGSLPADQVTTFNIMDSALKGFSISDLNITLDITHPNVSELSATLQYTPVTTPASPSLAPVSLFNLNSSSCSNGNILLTLDDQSAFSYASLLTSCSTSPAISGTYMAENALSAFDGLEGSGMFTLRIFDNVNNASSGVLNSVTLNLTQDTNIITFPGADGATYTLTEPATYTAIGADACGTATLTYNDVVATPDCMEPYHEIITRTWFAVDAQGNESGCVQTIYVFRNDISDLVFPPNYDSSNGGQPSLSCSVYGDVVPTSAVTGVPSGSFCDNVQIFDPEDTRIDICERSYKIVRHWKVVDWCSGAIIEHDQIIKVEDEVGPQLTCPVDITISASAYDCSGAMNIDKPTVSNECSTTLTYRLFYTVAGANGSIPANANYTEVIVSNGLYSINTLPFGLTQIKWDVEDNCGNSTTCTSLITVIDNVPPIAVCDEFTVVSLGSTGEAIALAATFDDGSNDNCGIDRFEARRVTAGCGFNTSYGPDVRFCCDEIGQTIQVEMIVYDTAGNTNTCTVDVTIQDKLPPYITQCPADITLDCQTMDITNLAVTGEPVAVDNCGIVDVQYSDSGSLDQCGEGTFTRVWKVTDSVGLQASCTQVITVEDSDPFDASNITWPANYDANSNGAACSPNLDPSTLSAPYNGPVLDDDFCSLTASTYEDQVFYFVEGACVKIIRTWTVIDWCTYDAALGTGLYTNIQVLKVENLEAPTFENVCAADVQCIYGDNCTGDVTFTQAVSDDCTPSDEITVNYAITGNGVSVAGSGLTVTTTLAPGTYNIQWEAEDHCGNIGVCEFDFIVRDCKAPTPYCHTAVASVVMNNSGSLSIWANDFDLGSYDNCTDQEDLVLSFSSDTSVQSLTFDCSDIPDGESNFISVEMWVTDLAGNQDFCQVFLDLQDNNADACNDLAPGFAYIRGNIMTETDKMVSNVEVGISSNQGNLPTTAMNTSVDGGYSFTSLPHFGNYYVSSHKNDDAMNGVSTLDLALIQKHILGITTFDSPYKTIAADINNSQNVSSTDLVILRKLILGIITEFPNNQESWRFVDRDDSFSDVGDPFPFDEILDFISLNQSQTAKDFIAVKVGDVNLNSNPNNFDDEGVVSSRNVTTTIVMNENEFTTGEMVTVPVYADQFNEMIGFQMSIDFDATAMSFDSWEAGYLSMSDDNFGFVNIEDGILTTSWTTMEELTLDNNTPLFTLKFRAIADNKVSQVIDVNSIITAAEAYNVSLETSDLELTFRNGDTMLSQGFKVYQNQPNPFNAATTIGFYTPTATTASLVVYDMTGRIIHQENTSFSKGEHAFILQDDQITTAGMLYYSIEANGEKVTKKMISIK